MNLHKLRCDTCILAQYNYSSTIMPLLHHNLYKCYGNEVSLPVKTEAQPLQV